MLKSFRMGGIHPPDNKLSCGVAIETFPLPEVAVIPLSQHIGAPASPVVAKGDKVKVGQIIANLTGFVSSNIHTSVSGTVLSIDTTPDSGGIRRLAITIQVEGDYWEETIDRSREIMPNCNLSSKDIIDKITALGIVGMGGATFPSQVKLSIPSGKKAEFLILNGVECEPYLTSDHRLMLERGEEMVVGAAILAKALGVDKIYVGIEGNKQDAIDHIREISKPYNIVDIVPLKVKYPQGGEKQLIAAITGREVPSGGLPIDVGVVVHNVATALAVYEAVQKNKPLIERVVTVTGKGVSKPSNLMVRIGTPISSLIAYCGGMDHAGKVVGGGPMMGRAVSNVDAPVTKGTSGILLMKGSESKRPKALSCIKCGKCITVCPMGLEPYLLSKMAKLGLYADMEEHHPTDCVECGSCQYTCPSALPLLDYVRLGKGEVMKIIRARK